MNKLNTMLSFLVVATLPAWAIAAGDHGTHSTEVTRSTPNAVSAPASGHNMPGMQGMQGMHSEMHASLAGMAGDPANVSRTVAVEMDDSMRFTPGSISVKAGESVRFFIVNKGKLPHEMVIGTADEIDEHAEMMKKMPGMAHQEANQITLSPGQRGGIVWQFAKAGTVTYACLVPGHKEAGMVGTVEVQ